VAMAPSRGARSLTPRKPCFRPKRDTPRRPRSHRDVRCEADSTCGVEKLRALTPLPPGWLRSPADPEEMYLTHSLHQLIAKEAASLKARPRCMLSGTQADKSEAEAFAERCLVSLAVWRRFGTAEFAQALGWVDRTDYAAMSSLVQRAVDAAVKVWKGGSHSVAHHTTAQRNTLMVELKAWGTDAAPGTRVEGVAGGEVSVRKAYERLLSAPHHPIMDLWRKRKAVVEAALHAEDVATIRDALLQVRGFCPPDIDANRSGWELAVDFRTITPLAVDPGPVEWNSAYVKWRRQRDCMRLTAPITRMTFHSVEQPRRRPSVTAHVDETGLSLICKQPHVVKPTA